MPKLPKFTFGTSVKQQIALQLRAHVTANFGNKSASAAKTLGISRQRLFSYMSGKSFPRLPMFDTFREKWGLELIGESPSHSVVAIDRGRSSNSQSTQLSLFDTPVTLKSKGLKVVIKRKGPGLVASIEIASDVEIA
jgi:hypothetical protein